MLKYAYTILYVDNVNQSVDFYEQAFGFERKFITPEGDYAEIKSGETTIAFASISLAESNLKKGFRKSESNEKPFGIELGFTTNQPEAVVEKAIKAGAKVVEEIVEKSWGQKVAYLRDNNGFLIEICTPIEN